jgi:subtilase family serine protease
MTRKPLAFPALPAVFLLLCLAAPSFGQTANVQSRIALPIEDSSLVTLHGNTHPYATAKFDQGAVDSSLTMHRMLLVLQRSPAQESTLEELLQEQQDKTSPNFHQWLTPEQFGAQFGPSQQDIQTISLWLQSHGFQVNSVAKGGILIDFTGTAAQVEQTFHTPIHKYEVQGKQYYANSQDPQIPTALSAVVAGIRSLHNFPARALNHSAGTFHRDPETGVVSHTGPLTVPQFNPGSQYECGLNGGPCETLGPFDLATIYNVSPLWSDSTPIDGTGQIIAISGETDINPADWTSFWAMFGVTAPKGKLNIILNGPDPGVQGDEPEADIDTQWSSAVAKGATIDYVESEATEATLGVDLSDEYIVDNNLAGVMSESYGICELFIGTSGNTFYNTLWQQAAAQGITVFISSGDQGSAVCDSGQEYAQNGLAVNGFGSTPYNVSVGGTDFNDVSTTSKYWNTTNNTTNFSNAKSYIPEETWNDSCTNSEIFPLAGVSSAEQSCNNAEVQYNQLLVVAGGSGGASNCTTSTGTTAGACSGGYAKPSWQSGSGVPSDGKRDVPDVSLFASNGFNGSFYIICQSDAAVNACSLSGNFQGYGGTSVASPAFAGIMALIEQKTGERQGNANYVFYKMANAGSNSCSSSSPTSSCVFYDIPSGSTIAMPCATGSPNCTTKTTGDPYGVLSGFATTSGYDQATGLGSVNVTNLVNGWSTYSGAFKGSKFSAFTMGPPTTITHGQPMPVAATVMPQSGTGTPTGSIVLVTNTGSSSSGEWTTPQTLALANGSLASGTTTDFLPGGTAYTVTAHYSGDGTYAPADSSPVNVTVNPESSKMTTGLLTYNPQTGAVTGTGLTTVTFGVPYLMRTDVTNSGGTLCATNDIVNYGCPTGTLTVNDTYNSSTGALDGGSFPLNTEAYAEDQNILLQGGQHSIAISYSGDKSYNASSTTATITVNKAATTISLNSGQSFITVGSNATFAASINASVLLPYNSPNSDFPADNVQFFDGGTPITGVLTYQTAAQTGGGPLVTATFSTASLKPGSHTITAQFTGDSNYSASTVSNSVTTDIQISTTGSTLTASSSTIQHGASETFTYTVVPSQTGGPSPTGTVQFTCYCGGAGLIFTAPVTNGQVQWVTSVLPGGSDQITASYGGDSNYQNSTENTSVTVTLLGSATSVSTSNASISSGTSVTLSATVAASKSGGPAPTGTVQFSAGTNSSGGSTTLGSAVPVTSGAASLTTTAIPAGTQFVFANYSGDANYSPSTASTAEVVAGAASFTVTAAPATINISQPGGTGLTTLMFAGANGFSGTIALSAASCTGLPAESSCSFGPSSVTLSSGTTSANTTLTVTTTAKSSTPLTVFARPDRRSPWPLPAFALAAILSALLFSTYLPALKLARYRAAALAVLAVVLLLTFTSCGGGGGGGGGTTNPGTPAGTYTLIVTCSGTTVTPAPTTNVTLTVQ